MKRKVIFLLYRILQALASPVILVYLLLRGLRNPRYFSTLRQRCGVLAPSWQQTISASIWFHAVSVGEVLAAIPLIEEVRKRSPRTPIFVSTTTLAGRETAAKRLTGLADGVFFAPFDFVWCVRRVLRRIRPTVVVVLETEIWPNLFRESKRIGCGLIIVNGRISDRAFPRYRHYAPLFSTVLALCDKILIQSAEMQKRFEAAGAPQSVLQVGGNLKYDFMPALIAEDSPVLKFIEADRARPLWIAASTSADDRLAEEDFAIAAQRKLPGWRLIIAPRKPERFEDAARLLERSGLRWMRRSALDVSQNADVLLLDSIGELSGLFPYAAVVFMGGTLADRGGHNILEPAIFGKPVIVGPHMENFREIAEHFELHRAVLHIEFGEQLGEAVLSAASDAALGHRARAAAEAKRGAAAIAASAVLDLYESHYPCERHPQPLEAFLWLLSLLWQAGSALDRRAKRNRVARLPVPVVSVGNITAGGTGKTPVIIELLGEFRDAGSGLLTRGHRRTIRENVLLLNQKDQLPVSRTGDEAQLCMQAAGVPIGIGPDRRATGMQLLQAADVRILFLDDGFQHLQLHRDFDLVLIDALRPFGGGELLPLGRLREPLDGLARASAFLITRANEVPNTKAIETVLRRYNATAPIYCAQTIPCKWKASDGSEFDPDQFPDMIKDMRAIAFCGLGNPQAFWRTLKRIGIKPSASYEYDDHHQYTPSEIRRLARHARDMGAGALLTTAKDAVNLDREYPAIIGSLKLYWLEVRTEINRRRELFDTIRSRVRS
ncbi:MAG: tetraacyldisaccharide 4'-kinase [Bryobacteraceae bacterium]